jgi:hypothetical protein
VLNNMYLVVRQLKSLRTLLLKNPRTSSNALGREIEVLYDEKKADTNI